MLTMETVDCPGEHGALSLWMLIWNLKASLVRINFMKVGLEVTGFYCYSS
jgi:hypothetical protein